MADLSQINDRLDKVAGLFDIDNLRREAQELGDQVADPNFWQKKDAADLAAKHTQSSRRVEMFDRAKSEVKELGTIIDQLSADESSELLGSVDVLVAELEEQAKFNGPYDHSNAIIYIYSGAGGDDAQDWAEMLLRMYTQWAEKSGYKATIMESTPGSIAGIKSAAVEIKGENAFGILSIEHGVHRLVRISPFNSGGTRETSFAKVDVLPDVGASSEINIDNKDLKVDVYRSGGKGGQSVNTTDSAVRITHLPTGMVVAIQNERSQTQNKETAMKVLKGRLAQLMIEQQKQHLEELKGPNQEAAWGNQIRNYVMHPYKLVKDARSGKETSDVDAVLSGRLDLVN